MGFATPYEVWVAPLQREAAIFVPMVCFWFAMQILFTKKLPVWLPNWRRLSREQQDDMVVRFCSIVNGLVMSISAALFLSNFYSRGGVFPDGQYTPMPYYRFSRVAIVAYFAWDVVVCFYYSWSPAWKIHGIFSFLGTYTLLFPFAENYAGYYTGCFELSNGFLHASIILRALVSIMDGKSQKSTALRLQWWASLCEYLFALLFLLIRVIGGTYVTGSWMHQVFRLFSAEYKSRHVVGHIPRLHDELAAGIAVLALATIQLLQYYWFLEIIKKAVGGSSEESASPSSTSSTDKKRKQK